LDPGVHAVMVGGISDVTFPGQEFLHDLPQAASVHGMKNLGEVH